MLRSLIVGAIIPWMACAACESACLVGTVFDAGQDAVFSGVTLRLVEQRQSKVITTRSDAVGRYSFAVPRGDYRLQVERGNFHEPLTMATIHLEAGRQHTLNVHLAVGGSIALTVTGDQLTAADFGLKIRNLGNGILRFHSTEKAENTEVFRGWPFLLYQEGFLQFRARRFVLRSSDKAQAEQILEGWDSVVVEADGESHTAARFVYKLGSRQVELFDSNLAAPKVLNWR